MPNEDIREDVRTEASPEDMPATKVTKAPEPEDPPVIELVAEPVTELEFEPYVPPSSPDYVPYEPPRSADGGVSSYVPAVEGGEAVRTASKRTKSEVEPYVAPEVEKKKRRVGIFGIILLVLGLIAVIGILTAAHPCTHGEATEVTCYRASRFIMYAGGIVAIIGLLRMLLKKNLPRLVLSVAAAVAGLLIAVVPGTILPICSSATMNCVAVMHPFAMLLGGVILLAGIVDALLASRQRRKTKAAKAAKKRAKAQ